MEEKIIHEEKTQVINEVDSNLVRISGFWSDDICFSHENHGRRYYEITVFSQRKSGKYDEIPIIISEELVKNLPTKQGTKIEVEGRFSSYDYKMNNEEMHLKLFVYANSIEQCRTSENDINTIFMTGHICSEPYKKITYSGKVVLNFMLAVRRKYSIDYIPCIAWGKTAQEMVLTKTVGSEVQFLGRLQSRDYAKILNDRVVTKSTYEVSIMKLIK